MYFPTLRIPDPSVKRANGFLIPEINHSSVSGTELNLPYFVALNKSSDIIFKPKVSTSKNVSLGVEYRKLFKKSDLSVDMSVTNDRNSSNKSKGYLFGNYDSKYENNIELSLQYQKTTDLNFLSQHTTKDLKYTETYVKLKKQDTSLYINSGLYQSKLQKSSVSDSNMANLRHETISDYIFYPKKLGGQANLLINLNGYKRQSTENGKLGRDAFRIKSDLLWRKDIITKKGYIIGLKSLSSAKVSKYYNDTNYRATLSKINQTNGIELSLPLVNRRDYSSTIYVPKLQLIYSAPHRFSEPNEDSFYSEISLANFSDLNRTYGMDRSENGLRLQTSIKTSHKNSKGFESEIFMGSINRFNGSQQFSSKPGTTEYKSNLFGAMKLNFSNNIKISGNIFSNDQFDLTKKEFQVNYMKNNLDVYSKYFQKDKDSLYGFAENRSELTIGTNYQFNKKTNSNLSLIYDLKNTKPVKSQFNSRYEHDCMAIDFYLSRGFYSVSTIKPGISLGVKVELTGLTQNNKIETSQRCNGS
jgi:LPS-assembly protein